MSLSRLKIAILGRTNAGKSSFLNLITGQDISITSALEGTTTDIVEKNQELPPIGPITWIDTAGFGDESELSVKRLEKTSQVLDRADMAILVLEGDKLDTIEGEIIKKTEEKNIPLIKIFNKKDLFKIEENGIKVNSTDKNSRDEVLSKLKRAIIEKAPDDFINQPKLLGDLAPEKSTVIMIVPIDFEAPKGRLILPQVQSIRDCLDSNQTVIVVKETEYLNTLNNLKSPPALVVCDSQVVDTMVKETPDNIKCTTFSILFARAKGDLNLFVEGAAAISKLQDNDKVLIAEACTHHASDDDIGKVKIPNWLKKKTGKILEIDFTSGHDFPENLEEYKLVVQCGGCMFNRKEILSRVSKCDSHNIPITNYGVCISELKDVLGRVLEPFPEAKAVYERIKNVKRIA